jgi:hypothetical protein
MYSFKSKGLIILYLLFSSSVLADGFNDNYLQLGYTTSDYKHANKITSIKGSIDFENDFLIWGDIYYEKGDWDDPGEHETIKVNKLLVGIEKSFPLSNKANITSSIIMDQWNNKQTRQATGSSTISNTSYKLNVTEMSLGYKNLITPKTLLSIKNNWGRVKLSSSSNRYYFFSPSISIRHISDSGIESSAKYLKVSKWSSNPIQSRLELNLIKHINDQFSFGARVSTWKQPDLTENGIFVRRSF